MTKSRKKSSTSTNPDQASLELFDIINCDSRSMRNTGLRPGCLCNEAEFKDALSEDIRHAVDEEGRELNRWEIVARMSTILNEEITWHTLNNWTARSHESHMPSLQELVAFVIATGGQRRAVQTLFRPAGIFPLPSPHALGAEAQRIDEHIRNLKRKKQAVVTLKKSLEKGGHS
jgi:hypothetical protein